jgi:hypothetical protein
MIVHSRSQSTMFNMNGPCRACMRVAAIVFCAAIGMQPKGALADVSLVKYFAESNALLNGDFHEWKNYKGGVTTESVGTPPDSMPTHWYGGPGVGAIATYDRLRSSRLEKEQASFGPWDFRVTWSKPPSKDWPGEAHHLPAFRFTFLESFEIADVRRFAGKNVRVAFFGRDPTGTVEIVPILWHSYDSQTRGVRGIKGKGYELFESSGKWKEIAIAQGRPNAATTCTLGPKWQRFEKIITLPEVGGKSITPGHYTGVGFDMIERCAPTVELANIEVSEVYRVEPDYHDPSLPREIGVKRIDGERYTARIPDTEDLAEYARRAINAATRMVSPAMDYSVSQVMRLNNPPVLQVQDGALLNINAKYAEALPMLRSMCGSDFNLQVDGRIIGALVNHIGKDGFTYQPQRRWANYDPTTAAAGMPFNDIFGEGRQLRAFAVWYMYDRNPLWKQLAERKIQRMLQMSIRNEDGTIYFWRGRGYMPGEDDPKRGRIHNVADAGGARLNNEMTGSPAAYIAGWTPQAGSTWHHLTGSQPALELAAGLARYVQRHGRIIDDQTGEFLADHPAHVTHTLLSNLAYALAAGDEEMIKWAKRGYEYNLYKRLDPGRTGVILSVDSDQIADMVQLGVMLSDARVSNYWEDVDRWLRNTFLPMQVREEDIERFKKQPYQPQTNLPPGHFHPEGGLDATLGGWGASLDDRGEFIGGGCGNSWRALYYVWDHILRSDGETLTVNLHLNCASPWADLDSYLPNQGRLVLRVKQDHKELRVRIPEWTDWNAVTVTTNNQRRKFKWDKGRFGYLCLGAVAASDRVVIEFPIRSWMVSHDLHVSTFVNKSSWLPCKVTLKSNTVINIDRDVWYPTYLQEKYHTNEVGMRAVERFVTHQRFDWQ